MSQRKKTIITSIVFGVIILLLIFLGFLPLVREIGKNSRQLIEAKRDLLLSGQKSGSIEGVSKRYDELEPNLEKVEGLFIDKGAPIDLIKFWEKTALDLAIDIDISPSGSGKKEGDPWDSLIFNINLTGSFDKCLRFIEKNENSPYLLLTRSLNIKTSGVLNPSSPSYSPSEDVSAVLTVKVFAK